MLSKAGAKCLCVLLLASPLAAYGGPVAEPGDLRLRHDLELLNDAGVINIPLTAWPVALGDVHAAVSDANDKDLSPDQLDALRRVREFLSWELDTGVIEPKFNLAGAASPRFIRNFEDTPREEGEVGLGMSWLGERFAVNLEASYVANPFDGDDFTPDGTYVGVALGNWMLTAGWQDRWWGPGRDGSLILGTNARPSPGLALQRNVSTPFSTKWLSWAGPWTLTTFMTQLEGAPVGNNALLFGVRGSFRPPRTGLEIGISRTAQWCGDGLPCDLGTFFDVLLGRDNRGVNVNPEEEPGNQLGSIDIRWKLPAEMPAAVYMQWAGEDGRPGAGLLGSWLRQLGAEFWGKIGTLDHRTHIEVSDTMCREGGFGFSKEKPDCAYNHPLMPAGYRYLGRSIAHPADGDSLSYSLGSTLVESSGHLWGFSLRHMEINRDGSATAGHSLYAVPHDVTDVQASHKRLTKLGIFYAAVGYSRVVNRVTDVSASEWSGFVQWSSHW